MVEREVMSLQKTLREKKQAKKRLVERLKRLEYEMGVLLKEITRRKVMVCFYFVWLLCCFFFFFFFG